jgi:tetratricopeptide (TPR) repeat protein
MVEASGMIRTDRKTLCYENRTWRFLHKPLLHIILITAVGLLAYSNTFDVPFHFDDKDAIVKNPVIKNLGNFFLHTGGYEYNPRRFLGYLTFALNYSIGGLDVTGYHVVNLAVHIINALLVYALVLLTFRTPALRASSLSSYAGLLALCAALFFVVHPIQTQAVTYIVQRFTSLTALFYLLSLCLYVKWRVAREEHLSGNRKGLWLYVLSLVTIVMAMKTKEIAFTLPIIIALYEFMFFEGRLKRRILYLIPVFSTMFIIPLTLLGMDKPIGELISDVSEATRVQTNLSRLDYLFTEFRVIVTYIRLLFLPINQNLDYDYPIYDSFFDPNVILSCLFIAALLGIGVYLLYRSRPASHHSRLIAFGIFWFFITLSVESGIIPIVDVIFEHRVYLPSVGFILVCVTGLAMLVERVNRKVAVRIIVVGVVTAVVMLGGMTYGRNRVWQNEITLWEDVVMKSPEEFRPHLNLGSIYAEQNRFDEAISEIKTALQLRPDYSDAYNSLGVAYSKQNLLDEAISAYKTAVQLRPDYADAYNNLGDAYAKQNRLDEAISAFKTALLFKPDYADAYSNLGVVYAKQSRFDEAISAFKTALQFRPDHDNARKNLKVCYDAIKKNEMIEQ